MEKTTRILATVRKTITRYNLLQQADHVLIAYSGGTDSSCLLAVLLELQKEFSLRLSLAHFNHKLRLQADEDERFVRETAARHSLPLFVGSAKVGSLAKKRKLNLEEAGRQLRYGFLKKTANKIGANKIATGHTLTDQAETLLMRIMRGSGLRGLSGIYPALEGMIIRPLIELEQEKIVSFLKEKNIPYRIDESNFDRRFLRNRIRLELIPFIKKNFEPQIVAHLARLASIWQEEETLLEKMTEAQAQNAFIKTKDGQLKLSGKHLDQLPLAFQRRLVRSFIQKLKGNLLDISSKNIETVLDLKEGKEIHLKKDLILRREEGIIDLKPKKSPEVKYQYRWSDQNIIEIKEIGLRFEAKELEASKVTSFNFNDKLNAYLDKSKLKFPLLIRNRKPGDSYQPLGAPGRKKLKEIMRAKHIPLSERDKLPVFLSQDRIIWVYGLPVSEGYKVKPQTRRILLIKKINSNKRFNE
ncbi:MAG: tRNA lysidine(34) synthetase TilS [Candidatus Aminicenantales bacterium]